MKIINREKFMSKYPKLSKNLFIGAATIAIVYGFYYKEVMIPYREEFRKLSYHLTDLRLIIQDEMAICENDPNLQNITNQTKLEKLFEQQEKSGNEILKLITYDEHSWPRKTHQDIHEFLVWTWPHYYYFRDNKACPGEFKSKDSALKLKVWQDTISANLPRYWFL